MGTVSGKYLTLFIGDEEYGIEIHKVQEIIAMMPITNVPNTSVDVCGVVNLRGKIIPVVSLRAKLGMMMVEHSRETCIVFVEGSRGTTGVIVDRVSEVVDVEESDLEPPPDFGDMESTKFLRGLGRNEESVRMLLDIDHILRGGDEFSRFEDLSMASDGML
ncbi:MAG: chemotaxis protein CheW [Sandaracinaceae bacterium]